MSGASSLAGRKRDRSARSLDQKGASASQRATTLERLAAGQKACRTLLRDKPYAVGLNDVAGALQRIYSAAVVVLRDDSSSKVLGLAPADASPEWVGWLDERRREMTDASVFTFPVQHGNADGAAAHTPEQMSGAGVDRFVVVPLMIPHGHASLYLGFGRKAAPTAEELVGFTLLGEYLSLLLEVAEPSGVNGTSPPSSSQRPRHAEPANPARASSKEELVSIAAHELRTPLTPITMLLQSLERKARAGDADVDSIVRTRRQVNRLTTMISDLLDLSRLREHRLVLSPVTVDIGPLLAQAVTAFREADPRRRLEFAPSHEPLFVFADETRVAQVFSSLLDHVARVAPPEATARAALERRGDRALLTIASERPSPRPELVAQEPLGTTKPQPLGLAVLFAEALIQHYGGTLQFENAHRGDVSVEATLPLRLSPTG